MTKSGLGGGRKMKTLLLPADTGLDDKPESKTVTQADRRQMMRV